MSSSIRISLDYSVIQYAAYVGAWRQIEAIKRNAANGRTSPRTGWQYNIDGAMAEAAVATWLGVWWDGGPHKFKEQPDIVTPSGGYEIRANGSPHGDLILTDRDSPDAIYILVLTAEAPIYELCGWTKGEDGMTGRWKRKPRADFAPAHFVPQDELNDMATLPGYQAPTDVPF